ncbi:hypothetical protein [Anaerococcus sp. Marseille-P3915]|uniref:hypothetical protein n=1 Tax=Anaerococcus sp. Marseille-P3915 TaxID=2057799 RepID=UPI000D0ADC3D|nr:hypothetical protein [Anaerococcus sp. Marseille-P3915]
MDFDKIRKQERDRARIDTIKARLRNYGSDMRRYEDEKVKIEIARDRLSLGASWSASDVAKGGGSSQEDLQVKIIDKIDESSRRMKLIEIENRAMKLAIADLEEDKKFIVDHMWIAPDGKRLSFRKAAEMMNLSKSTVQRLSDDALLYIFNRLYLIEGGEVDVR